MIIIFGGTTEGRLAASVLDEAGSPFFYSTRGALQQVEGKNMTRHTGAMDADAMIAFCRENGIKCIVDAAHPFAVGLHEAVAQTSADTGIPVVRLERTYPPRIVADNVVWCDDFDDALVRLESKDIESLFALTGVQTIRRLKPYWSRHRCVFRILDREESRDLAQSEGFPADCLVKYSDGGQLADLIREISPQALITKESGESGGFEEKYEAAREFGLKLFVVKRPVLPSGFVTVTGRHGLRRAVEKLCPGFFPLRSGFTTGACATAAAKAAITALVTGEAVNSVEFSLPDGELTSIEISSVEISENSATAQVVKDGGDDPDVTHGKIIEVEVRLSGHDGIVFHAGEGVGTVTLPGLGLAPGEPAINPVPRKMIATEIRKVYDGGVDVTVSVPGGRELALRTFNPKLGIEGGISIIGTSGIVRPFSSEAFVESLRREMEVAVAIGCTHIVVNSGARSERFVKALYPEYPPQAFIHYGNAIGETMKIASQLGIGQLTIGLMIGKAVKLAEGHTDTHSGNVVMNRNFLIGIAREAGCSADAVEKIAGIRLARELWTVLDGEDARRFFSRILELCHAECRRLFPRGRLEAVLVSDSGEIPYRME